MIAFTAYGIPAPKGSMKAFMPKGARFPVVTHDNARTRPWASLVKAAALDALNGSVSIPLALGPVSLSVAFYMPKPKSLPKRVTCCTKKPDVDKLCRLILDSLTGVIWQDDSQVVELRARKVYVQEQGMPRAEIRVEEYAAREVPVQAVNRELFEASFR